MFMDHKQVQRIKEQYPQGPRIRLIGMDDPYAPILPGTEGTVMLWMTLERFTVHLTMGALSASFQARTAFP
jgi:hypothetical protein